MKPREICREECARTVEISLDRYDDLVRASEKIEVIKRMVSASEYISTADILMILGIEKDGAK